MQHISQMLPLAADVGGAFMYGRGGVALEKALVDSSKSTPIF
jgi:hypothetical protein